MTRHFTDRDRVAEHHCSRCFGLAHRRPASGCLICEEPFIPEVISRPELRRASTFAEWENW
jgi:hypothetical protein